MHARSLLSLIPIVALAVAPVAVTSAAAASLPAGCTLTVQTPSTSGTVIKGAASGSCITSKNRTLLGELWHDYNFVPDARVVQAGDTGTKTTYRAAYSVCDNGGTTTYYTRGLFSGYSYTLTSPKATLSHC